VAQSVRQRVAALPEGAREVLGVAAVVGRVVPSALLAGAAARPEEEVVAAFDAACQARLLEQQGEEAYQFAHDVIREVVEADLGAARHRLLHRRVAEMLEREPGDRPIELLAYHYARSSEREKALPYVEQAGDRAMAQYANASAVAYYQELVDRLEGMGRSQDAAAAREKLGAVFFTMARYDAALAVFGQAEEAYRAVGDLGSVGRVAVQIGDVHHERGTPDEGLAHIQPLLDALDEHSPPAGSETLYQVLAHLYFASRRYARQLAAADRAADLARSAGNDWVLADAENDRGLALLLLGRPEEALPFLGRAAQLAQAVGNLNTLNWALSNTGSAYLRLGELEMARRYMERALELAERRGNLVQSAFQTYLHGLISFFGGDWGQAHLAIERAAAVSQECGPSWAAAYPVYGRGLLCLVTGEWDAAAHHLEECKAVAVRSGGRGYAEAEGALAWRDLLAGCPETALARLAPLLESLGQEAVVTDLLPLLAWAHLEAGALEEASAVAAQAIRQAEAQNARRSLADALWVQARVALRQGHREGAAQGLEEGLMLVRRMPYPYGEARLLEVYGDLHVQMGEIPTARERLEAALAIVKQLGAHKDAERIAQGIAHRANGARPSAGRARRAGHRRRG
jgi:tetratricopeptide (TPR) repeat protein